MSDTPLTTLEKQNAMISYCFLAPFMLLSRDERFSGSFVRSHARYALIIQIAFLALLILYIRSRNFSSMIIFGASWVHIVLFIAFIGLLWFLSVGIYGALRGQKPRISIENLSWSSLKNIGTETTVEEAKRTPLILSHIPFFGTFLAHKYGDFLIPGEKFGNWAFIIAALLLWVDSSLTLFIIWIAGTTFWVVYQSVLVLSGDNVHLIGTKLAGSAKVHIVLRSIFIYLKGLINRDNNLPVWSQIVSEQTEKLAKETYMENTKIRIPLVNIPSIFHAFRTKNIGIENIEGLLINILFIYACWLMHIPLLMILMLGIWTSYWQAKYHKNSSLPILTELSIFIIKISNWMKKKSTPEEIHLTHIQ